LGDPDGDTDEDGALDVDETWTYSFVYDVQTADIEDPDGVLNNTANATTDQGASGSDSADVPIESPPAMMQSAEGSVSEPLVVADPGDKMLFIAMNAPGFVLPGLQTSDVGGGSFAPGAGDLFDWPEFAWPEFDWPDFDPGASALADALDTIASHAGLPDNLFGAIFDKLLPDFLFD
jgi:hypothetical protein